MTKSEQNRWTLAEYVKAYPRRGWYLSPVTLRRQRLMTAYGHRWRMTHLVQSTTTGFVAVLNIGSVEPLRASVERKLRAQSTFSNIDNALALQGYQGGWCVETEITGFWRRPLSTPRAAIEELQFLDSVYFPKNGSIPLSERRRLEIEPPVVVSHASKHVAATWKFIDLARNQRQRSCSLEGIMLQRSREERLGEHSWQAPISIGTIEGRLGAYVLPSFHSDSRFDTASLPLRPLEKGFHQLGMQGRWHHHDFGVTGIFSREGPISPERFVADREFLERIRLADVLKLGAEQPRGTTAKKRRRSVSR